MVPELTALASWGWLSRLLAALCTRGELLRAHSEACGPAEVADPAARNTTRYSHHMGKARDRDRVAMDVGNAKQPKTPRTGTEWPLAGTPRLPARAYPAPAGVAWPKLHEDGRGPLNLGLLPPHSKKAVATVQVNEVAEGAYTLKEAMRLTVQSKPWNEAGRPVGSGLSVAPQPSTARPPRTDPPGSR